jgi:uncharacterized protein
MVDESLARAFLARHRIAVVGASDEKSNFAKTIYQALRDHGHEVVAVNPNAPRVDGDPCYPSLAAVPGEVDGAVVMVSAPHAAQVVRDCASRGIDRVWLFKGLGGPGAVSDEALDVAREHDIEVIAGACPMMFLEPVGWFHRAHRTLRRHNGSLVKA